MVLMLGHSLEDSEFHVKLSFASHLKEILKGNTALQKFQVIILVNSRIKKRDKLIRKIVAPNYLLRGLQEIRIVLIELWSLHNDGEPFKLLIAFQFFFSNYPRTSTLLLLLLSNEALMDHTACSDYRTNG